AVIDPLASGELLEGVAAAVGLGQPVTGEAAERAAVDDAALQLQRGAGAAAVAQAGDQDAAAEAGVIVERIGVEGEHGAVAGHQQLAVIDPLASGELLEGVAAAVGLGQPVTGEAAERAAVDDAALQLQRGAGAAAVAQAGDQDAAAEAGVIVERIGVEGEHGAVAGHQQLAVIDPLASGELLEGVAAAVGLGQPVTGEAAERAAVDDAALQLQRGAGAAAVAQAGDQDAAAEAGVIVERIGVEGEHGAVAGHQQLAVIDPLASGELLEGVAAAVGLGQPVTGEAAERAAVDDAALQLQRGAGAAAVAQAGDQDAAAEAGVIVERIGVEGEHGAVAGHQQLAVIDPLASGELLEGVAAAVGLGQPVTGEAAERAAVDDAALQLQRGAGAAAVAQAGDQDAAAEAGVIVERIGVEGEHGAVAGHQQLAVIDPLASGELLEGVAAAVGLGQPVTGEAAERAAVDDAALQLQRGAGAAAVAQAGDQDAAAEAGVIVERIGVEGEHGAVAGHQQLAVIDPLASGELLEGVAAAVGLGQPVTGEAAERAAVDDAALQLQRGAGAAAVAQAGDQDAAAEAGVIVERIGVEGEHGAVAGHQQLAVIDPLASGELLEGVAAAVGLGQPVTGEAAERAAVDDAALQLQRGAGAAAVAQAGDQDAAAEAGVIVERIGVEGEHGAVAGHQQLAVIDPLASGELLEGVAAAVGLGQPVTGEAAERAAVDDAALQLQRGAGAAAVAQAGDQDAAAEAGVIVERIGVEGERGAVAGHQQLAVIDPLAAGEILDGVAAAVGLGQPVAGEAAERAAVDDAALQLQRGAGAAAVAQAGDQDAAAEAGVIVERVVAQRQRPITHVQQVVAREHELLQEVGALAVDRALV